MVIQVDTSSAHTMSLSWDVGILPTCAPAIPPDELAAMIEGTEVLFEEFRND